MGEDTRKDHGQVGSFQFFQDGDVASETRISLVVSRVHCLQDRAPQIVLRLDGLIDHRHADPATVFTATGDKDDVFLPGDVRAERGCSNQESENSNRSRRCHALLSLAMRNYRISLTTRPPSAPVSLRSSPL